MFVIVVVAVLVVVKNPPTKRGGDNDISKLLVINDLSIMYMIGCWGKMLGACWKMPNSTHSEKNPAGGSLGPNKNRNFHLCLFIKRRYVLNPTLYITIYTHIDFLPMSN